MRLNYIDNIDCMEGLAAIPDNSVDLVLADPPYSSGGAFAGDRKSRTAVKYTGSYGNISDLADFSGDNMDQRGFTEFCRQVFAKCREKTKPEGVIVTFIDWRNLPAMTDALQAAGWTWRGIAVWHKPNGRPMKGRYRQEFEFVVWGSNGPMPFDRGVGCLHLQEQLTAAQERVETLECEVDFKTASEAAANNTAAKARNQLELLREMYNDLLYKVLDGQN